MISRFVTRPVTVAVWFTVATLLMAGRRDGWAAIYCAIAGCAVFYIAWEHRNDQPTVVTRELTEREAALLRNVLYPPPESER